MSLCSSNKSDSFSFASMSSSHASQVTGDNGASSSEQWHDFESKCSSKLHNTTFTVIKNGLIVGPEQDSNSQPPKSVRRACNRYSKYMTIGNQIEKEDFREKRVVFSHKPPSLAIYPQLVQNKKETHIKAEQDKQDKTQPEAGENVGGKAIMELENQFQIVTCGLQTKFAEENQLLHNIIDHKDEKIQQLKQNESRLLKQLQDMSNQLEQIGLLAEKKPEFRH
uniref:Uncharacterized protein n=1 Tax=Ditylenchus dipsaci TaxID=166011 RepID=A0A915CT73_9BILA